MKMLFNAWRAKRLMEIYHENRSSFEHSTNVLRACAECHTDMPSHNYHFKDYLAGYRLPGQGLVAKFLHSAKYLIIWSWNPNKLAQKTRRFEIELRNELMKQSRELLQMNDGGSKHEGLRLRELADGIRSWKQFFLVTALVIISLALLGLSLGAAIHLGMAVPLLPGTFVGKVLAAGFVKLTAELALLPLLQSATAVLLAKVAIGISTVFSILAVREWVSPGAFWDFMPWRHDVVNYSHRAGFKNILGAVYPTIGRFIDEPANGRNFWAALRKAHTNDTLKSWAMIPGWPVYILEVIKLSLYNIYEVIGGARENTKVGSTVHLAKIATGLLIASLQLLPRTFEWLVGQVVYNGMKWFGWAALFSPVPASWLLVYAVVATIIPSILVTANTPLILVTAAIVFFGSHLGYLILAGPKVVWDNFIDIFKGLALKSDLLNQFNEYLPEVSRALFLNKFTGHGLVQDEGSRPINGFEAKSKVYHYVEKRLAEPPRVLAGGPRPPLASAIAIDTDGRQAEFGVFLGAGPIGANGLPIAPPGRDFPSAREFVSLVAQETRPSRAHAEPTQGYGHAQRGRLPVEFRDGSWIGSADPYVRGYSSPGQRATLEVIAVDATDASLLGPGDGVRRPDSVLEFGLS